MSNNEQSNNNSMFLYTALIFIAAIIIIIVAFFSQAHLDKAQPTTSPITEETTAPQPTSDLQGIAKSTAELSDKNLELLEENRDLNKRLDSAETENDSYTKLLEAYGYLKASNLQESLKSLSEIDYNSLSSDAKLLYDEINSQVQ